MFITEGFHASGIQFELVRAADGERSLERLLRYRNSDAPDVIILDLNLAQNRGLHSACPVRENPAWLTLPSYVILTSSREPSDRD
jgi:CheY-like chemotaxis protein